MRGRLIAILVAFACPASIGAGDVTVYLNANIYTVDPARPRAAAMAIADGRVLAIGSEDEVRGAAGEGVRTIDLGGRTILPGLIDAHGHMAGLGALGLGVLDLSGAQSLDQLVERTAGAAGSKGRGEWVLGGRWDHESWSSRELPMHEPLSAATPDHPVWLRRVDGHAGLANRRAMELAGITERTADPPGGEIIRGPDGRPTGILVDNAMALIERQIPPGARGTPRELILRAQELCLIAGLTGVHDAGISPAEIGTYRQLAEEGGLKLRIYAMLSARHAMRWFDEHEPIVTERFTVRSAKLYMDGAMGSRGAWLLGPYADRPTGPDGGPYTGLAVADPAFIRAVAEHAVARGYQVCTHAIGDRANREVLDAYEGALGSAPRRAADGSARTTLSAPRFRIEHAQLLHADDIPRFARLGVIASMQPTHCTSDMRWVEDRVGRERAGGAYAWASLLRSGAIIAGGSDFPVESHGPFLGFYAAITRQDLDGRPAGGWLAGERMTREEALRSMTLHAAHAAFEEAEKGSLTPGKFADFIVIDRDVMTCEPADIAGTRVLLTVIGGEVVYDSGRAGL